MKRKTVFYITLLFLLIGGSVIFLTANNNLHAQNAIKEDTLLSENFCNNHTLSSPHLIPANQLPIIADLGFETNDSNIGWDWGGADYNNTSNAGFPPRLEIVPKSSITPSSPAKGENILKATVISTDCINNGARAEVWLRSLGLHEPTPPGFNPSDFRAGNDTWFHWYMMFPKNMTISNTWHIPTQWHGMSDNFSLCHFANGTAFECSIVPMGFNLRNYSQNDTEPSTGAVGPTLEFSVFNSGDANPNPSDPGEHYATRDILWITWNGTNTFQFNHWYEILLHVKWDPCTGYDNQSGKCVQTAGFVELWVDGLNVVPKTSHETLSTVYGEWIPDPAYLKQGLYHCTSTSVKQDSNHDGIMEYIGNHCIKQRQPIPPNQTMYYDGTVIALCDEPHMKNFHPETQTCEVGPPYP